MELKNILVHLHLYYQEQLDFFLQKLSNISGCRWDLFVTVCEKSDDISKKILEFKPDAHIILVKNIGYDVYPFIQVLNLVDIDNYDYVLKIHTKNFRMIQRTIKEKHMTIQGFSWRDNLVNTLIGTKSIFKKNLELLNNKRIGMICSKTFLFKITDKTPEDTLLLSNLKKRLKIENSYGYFCAGTMFIIKANILKQLKDTNFNEYDFGQHIEQTESCGNLAHAIERIFTILTDYYGLKVCGRNVYLFSFKDICQKIFSIKDSWDNKHKVLTVFGLKLKKRKQEINPSFSVIMPVLNSSCDIEKAVNNLLNQIYQNWELIIIDNTSGDLENDLYEKYNNFFKSKKFIYIKTSNKNLSSLRNMGLSKVINEWVVYFDSNSEMSQDFLETFANSIKSNRKIKCFYAQAIRNNYIIGQDFDYKTLCSKNFIDLGVFVHHKSLKYKQKFNIDLNRYEDWDLIATYSKFYKPQFINKVLLRYNNEVLIEENNNIQSLKLLKYQLKKYNFPLIKNFFSIEDYISNNNVVGKIITICFCKLFTYKFVKIINLLIDKFKKQYENDIAIVAIIKNEAPYIKEWIEYHRLIGINKFYIYDNESTDNLKTILQEYIDKEIVTYTLIEGVAQQCVAYNDAIKRYKYRNKYMAFIDADEFIYLEDEKNLMSVINDIFIKNKNCGGFIIQWCLFNSSGHVQKPEGLVIENYTNHLLKSNKINEHIKTICNPRKVFIYAHCHFPIYYSGLYSFDTNNNIVEGPYNKKVCWDKIRLNHYYTKSFEEFKEKIARGRADIEQKRKIQEFYEIEACDSEKDESMLQYAEILKTRINNNK